MAYRRPPETRRDRVNRAIENYAARDPNITPGLRNEPQPLSGRFFIWMER